MLLYILCLKDASAFIPSLNCALGGCGVLIAWEAGLHNACSQAAECDWRCTALPLQGLFEVWGEGATWDELVHSVNAFPEARKQLWLGSNTTMKVPPVKSFTYGCGSMQLPSALARKATCRTDPCRGKLHVQMLHRGNPTRFPGSFAGLVHASSSWVAVPLQLR